MMTLFISELILIFVCWRPSLSSTLVMDVVVFPSYANHTFSCNLSSSTNLTRWTYSITSTESNQTSLMSYQNGSCTMSPSYFLREENIKISYSCSGTTYNVTSHATSGSRNKHILSCRDAKQPDISGSTWMIRNAEDVDQCNCDPKITFSIREIYEGDDITFICRVPSDVSYVNWNRNLGSNTAAMSVQNEQCTTSPSGTTFIDNTNKYIYTCNRTVYQVTILKVQRTEHNDMYTCTTFNNQNGTGSNWVIKVIAPVTSVTITPSNYLVNVKENTAVELTCKTSTARPAASVYWYRNPNGKWQNSTRITDNITVTTDYNDFSLITSVIRFVPTRLDNDTKIQCKANNSISTNLVYSERILLNVLYKADNPYILQGNTYSIVENTPVTLSCSVKCGNPTPTLSWRCDNFSPSNQTTINSNGNVTTTLTWNVSRTHKGTCACTSTQTGFTTETINLPLVVLYPPSKPKFRVNGSNADGDVYFIKGNNRSINCIADSKPSPGRYTWTGPTIAGTVNIQSLRLINIKKTDAGEYKCSVHNTMNPSNGEPVAGINSRTVNVVVLYPPSALYFVYGNQSGHNISNKVIDVIQEDTFDIVCISIDGNPSPTIKWNEQRYNGSVLTVDNIKEAKPNATCTATNNMKETNRQPVQGNISDTIRFNILIRPTIIGCGFYYENLSNNVFNMGNDISNTLEIKENESFTLKCSAGGNPSPIVWWKTPQESLVSSSSVIVNNLTRQRNGDYVITANSLLKPSFKVEQNVTVNKTVSVQVLYPPEVLSIKNISKLKGERLNLICNYTAGIPEITLIKWTRSIDNKEWNEAIINIDTLKKNDTGIYTCTASNIMIQSGDSTSYIGQHNQSFHLDVQYAASITSFTIDGLTRQNVTVNEKEPVKFSCNGDSNPTAMMTLSHKSKILKNSTSNNVEYNIANASCLDAATYYCSVQNVHNAKNKVSDKVQLFVNCEPRVGEYIDANITSEKNHTTTIVFNAIAYPPPTFTWYQFVDGNWTFIHDDNNYNIVSANLQSILTINHVGMDDFTSYKIIVKNDFGQMEQMYTLSPYDKPDPPTRLRHIEGRTTTSSIHIEWKPGFDNGPPQTFHIKYKKISDTVWNYLNVSDNGEPTMTITLTGLLENTQYDVIIFASNVKGHSSESDVLITRTKAIPNSPLIHGALIGGIAGGVTGCIVIVIVIVFIIRRYPLFKGNGADGQNIRSVTSRNNSSSEDSAYNTVSSVHNYEMFNLNHVESTPYALLDQTEQHNVMTSGNGADGQNIRSVTSRKNYSSEDSAYNTVSSVHNYDMVNLNNVESTPYALLDQTDQYNVMTPDATSKNINDEYENMKIQVF